MLRRTLPLCLFLALVITLVQAQDDSPLWEDQQQQLIASDLGDDPNQFHLFGRKVALDGDTAVVSAPFATVGDVQRAGAVYIFERSGTTWIEQGKITSPDGQMTGFGGAIALQGDTLVISALGDEAWLSRNPTSDKMSPRFYDAIVYVYRRDGNTWSLQSVLSDPVPGDGDRFGYTIALGWDRLALSTDGTLDDEETAGGAVYMYRRKNDEWVFDTTLVSPISNPLENFGMTLAMDEDGDTLVVDADYENVYVFRRINQQWRLEQTFAPTVWYPTSIGITPDGNTIAIGSPYEHIDGLSQVGTIELFTYNGHLWEHSQSLRPEPLIEAAELGTSIDMDDEYLIATGGAAPDAENEVHGVAHIFQRVNGVWKQQVRLISFDLDIFKDHTFGTGTAIDGEYAVIGASEEGGWKYSAYAYKIPGLQQAVSDPEVHALLPLPGTITSGYTTFHVALKTRPTKDVKLILKSKDEVLLDNGDEAAKKLTLRFTRENWNLPQIVRVRGSAAVSGAITATIKHKIKGSSAIEYLYVIPQDVTLAIAPDTFGQVAPVDGALIEAPYSFTWQPYPLATHYKLKVVSLDQREVYKMRVDPALACTPDLCTFKPDVSLRSSSPYQWRVTAKDKPAAFKKVSSWSVFSTP